MDGNIYAIAKSEVVTATPFVLGLVVMVFLDTLSGLVSAFGLKKLNSTVSRLGAARKIAKLLVVAVAALFDPILPNVSILSIEFNLTAGIAILLMFSELVSLSENFALIGIKLPKPLRDALEKVQEFEADQANTTIGFTKEVNQNK